jgi:hypothetical protein
VTSGPTPAWVWRQLVQGTPQGRVPRFLIRGRVGVYGPGFPGRRPAAYARSGDAPTCAPSAARADSRDPEHLTRAPRSRLSQRIQPVRPGGGYRGTWRAPMPRRPRGPA